MTKKELIKQKIEHLEYDRQMLIMCKPMLYSSEQKEFNKKKIEFVENWIQELEDSLNG